MNRVLSAFCQNHPAIVAAVGAFAAGQMLEVMILLALDLPATALCRWDCEWYATIVDFGYDTAPVTSALSPYNHHQTIPAANYAFFPLHPLLASAVDRIGDQSTAASLMITSKIFLIAATYSMVKLGKTLFPEISEVNTALVVALNPFVVFANSGYTEPLFLFLTSSSLYFLYNKRPILSAIFGMLAALTRLIGVLFVIPFLIRFRGGKKHIVGVLLVPTGTALFIAYLYFHTGDGLAFLEIQKAWGRAPQEPVSLVFRSIQQGGVESFWAISAVVSIASSLYLAKHKHYDLALIGLLATIIPLTSGIGSMHRYVMWQPAFLLTFSLLLAQVKSLPLKVAGLSVGLTYCYFVWLSGEWWLV